MGAATPDTAVAPLVSIITPSFGHARWIEATLSSVASQEYPIIEHIVVDGGSTDGTIEILARWAKTHPIIWHSEPDEGQADAIRKGVGLSRGSIVAWLNSDDVYLDERVISDVVALFKGGARFVTGGGRYIDGEGRLLDPIPVYPDRVRHATTLCADWFLQPATFVDRRLMLGCPLDVGLKFAFDWDLFIRLTALAEPVVLDRPLAGYRVHPDAKTQSGGVVRRRELAEVTRRYQGRSIRYWALHAMIRFERLAAVFPTPVQTLVDRALGRLAALSSSLTRGRGIPA